MATSSSPSDDYFGASYIGASPYSNSTSDYINQLSALHSMVSNQANSSAPVAGVAPGPGASAPQQPTNSWNPLPGTFGMGAPAQNAQVNNPTNFYRSTTANPTYATGGVQNGQPYGPAGYPIQGFNGTAAPRYDMSGTNIPPDIQNLRNNVSGYLQANLQATQGQQPNYQLMPGSDLFNLGTPMGAQDAYTMAMNSPQIVSSFLGQGGQALRNLTGFNAQGDYSQLQPALQSLLSGKGPQLDLSQINSMAGQGFNSALNYGNQGAVGLNAAMPIAQNIAQTGGAPIQQLLASLNNIQNQGQTAINNNLAQIREQYGAQGLGQGSDISNALGLGVTQGQQQIESQQSSLLTNILQQAAQTQLGGVNAMNSIGTGLGSIGNMISGASGTAGNLYGTGQQLSLGAQNTGINAMLGALTPGLNILQQPVANQLASAGIQLGAAQAMPQTASVLNQAFGQGQQTLLGLAQLNQNANEYTNQAQYQNFLRQTNTLPPALQAALQMSTSYPPANNQPGFGTSLMSGLLGAGGNILGGMFSGGFFG